MSRSKHPTKHNLNTQPRHPYWEYGWWLKHGPKYVRQDLERKFRRRTRQAIQNGTEPPLKPEDPKWIWW